MTAPIGSLTVIANRDGVLQRVLFAGQAPPDGLAGEAEMLVWDEDRCQHIVNQLDQYFQGERRTFELELELHGTPFQLSVWHELQRIAYGTTITYHQLAQRIGRPTATRAVGLANGQNPIPIIIPCHRVIGSDGSLTGFGGGLEIKRALLVHEGAMLV
jgi:methylated-DNA-[protein]-cysteine S-methyltransferase